MTTDIELKDQIEHIPDGDKDDTMEQGPKPTGHVPLKSAADTLTVRQSLFSHKRAAVICMIAAFSASCDGYQGHFNGSIVANKGESMRRLD